MAAPTMEGFPPDLQLETKLCCAKLDSICHLDWDKEGIPPDLQPRLSEGIPPDQQRRCISELDAEISLLENLQIEVEAKLRLAKAHRAVAAAKEALKHANMELEAAMASNAKIELTAAQPASEAAALPMANAAGTPALNPSAPTDCKVVQKTDEALVVASGPELSPQHPGSSPRQGVASNGVDAKPKKNAKTKKKRMRQQSLQEKNNPEDEAAQSRQEPEPEVAQSRQEPEEEAAQSRQEPTEGHVQHLIASFEALGKELEPDNALEPAFETNREEQKELEPDGALEPNKELEREDAQCMPDGIHSFLAGERPRKQRPTDEGTDEKELEPDNALKPAIEPNEDVESELEPDNALEPASEDSSDDAESYVVHQSVQNDVKLEPANELEPAVVKGRPAEFEDKAQVIRAAVPRIFSIDWAEEIIQDARSLEAQTPGIGLAFLTYMAKDFIEAQDAPT